MRDKKITILGVIIGLLLDFVIVGVVAYSAYADDVVYNNTNSGLTSTDANGAIDEINDKIDNQWCKKGYSKDIDTGTGVYTCEPPIVPHYAFGDPTIHDTTDYTTLNKKVFAAIEGKQKSICIIRNNNLHCFKINDESEIEHFEQVFSDVVCTTGVNNYGSSSHPDIRCNASDVSCYTSSGRTNCTDHSNYYCMSYTNNYVECRNCSYGSGC